jgi:hypothetical protein
VAPPGVLLFLLTPLNNVDIPELPGIQYCIAAPLARLERRVFVEESHTAHADRPAAGEPDVPLPVLPIPLTESLQQVRDTAADDAVYYGTKLSGASNQKAKI